MHISSKLSSRLAAVAAATALLITLPAGGQSGRNEAPAGFDNESNGAFDADRHAKNLKVFESDETAEDGLGPIYNATSCVACHQNPVTGGQSQSLAQMAGHFDAGGSFVPAVLTNGRGTASVPAPFGLVLERAICSEVQMRVPETGETVRGTRKSLSLLGLGYVEAIDDASIAAIAAAQPRQSGGRIAGQVAYGAVLESSPPTARVGRFSSKSDFGSLLSSTGLAYFVEMGITNRLAPVEQVSMCDRVADPEDNPRRQPGDQDIDRLTAFLRGTKVPPRDRELAATADVRSGAILFESIGCAICHVDTFVTAPAGTAINGGTYRIPQALGNRTIHPYSDFLLHDIGTGDGIPGLNPGSATKFRTSPLWGVRINSRLMHDGQSRTFTEAIQRHGGEAAYVRNAFNQLSRAQQHQLIVFLRSL